MADPEMQKRFIELEEAKLEEARLMRQEQKEEAERQLRIRENELQLREEEFVLRRREVERQEKKDRTDAEKQDAVVSKVKLYGDAFRNAAFKMSNDPIDALPFFEHCERLFVDIQCPAAIQTQLIRPYLSDRVKQLVSRMDPARAASYRELKLCTSRATTQPCCVSRKVQFT
jgi:hypothetical protein